MAGITGIYAYNQVGGFYMVNLAKAIDSMILRGQEVRGSYLGKDLAALGCRDHKQQGTSYLGKQPFTEPTGRYTIVADCQLTNTAELKEMLITAGHEFISEAPAEMLLNLYMKHGTACANLLSGAYAFAVYDDVEQVLFLSRDCLGEKPLYFYNDEDKFIFASQLKALLAYNVPAQVDQAVMLQYVESGFNPFEESIVKGIQQVKPGCTMLIKNKELSVSTIATLFPENSKKRKSPPITSDEIWQLLEQETALLTANQSSCAVILDKGLAPAVLAMQALAAGKEVFSFSAKLQNSGSSEFVNKLSRKLGTQHEVILLDEDLLQAEARNFISEIDQPFADPEVLMSSVLFKEIKRKTSCYLAATGAELLKGPEFYTIEQLLEQNDPLTAFILKFGNLFGNLFRKDGFAWARLFSEARHSSSERLWKGISGSSKIETANLYKVNAESFIAALETKRQKVYQKESFADYPSGLLRIYVSEVIAKKDLCALEHLSSRFQLTAFHPFLKPKVLQALLSFKQMDYHYQKKIQRQWDNTWKNLLPKGITAKENNSNLSAKLLEMLRPWFLGDKLLGSDFISHQGFFEYHRIKTLKENASPTSNQILWRLLIFQHWYKKYLSKEPDLQKSI